MNGNYYVGQQISNLTGYDTIGPITGVTLVVNNDTQYTAGILTGYVITVDCPYGTQEMANDIIARVYGETYHGYRAENAVLKPQAELGDAITVGDIYSVLAYRRVEFSPGHMSEIAAPGENELDHEFQYQGTSGKEISNDVDSLRAYLNRALGELSLQVTTLTGRVEALTQLTEQISNKVTELDSRVTALEGRL